MSGRIFLGNIRNFFIKPCSTPSFMRQHRHCSQNIASDMRGLEAKIGSQELNSQLQIKEIRFIGSEKLRRSTPQEIQDDPKLLQELSEAYKMMAQDEEARKATSLCASVMSNRRTDN